MRGPATRAARASGPPDYVGVGPLWSTGPWWHNLLVKHPDVRRRGRRQRTLEFFRPFCDREFTEADVDAYHAQFPRRSGQLTGEWSQRYLHDFWTPPLLHRAAPDAKLLVLLDDPMERYRRRLGATLRSRPPQDASYFLAGAIARALYARQLQDLWRWFSPEQTLVLQLERCRADPPGEYRRTLRFLGLSDDFQPFGRVRTRVAARVRRAAARARPAPRAELWPDLERALRRELEDDVVELQRLVPDLDLELWPEFAGLAAGRGAG